MNRIILSALLILVAGGGIYYYLSSRKSVTKNPTQYPKEVILGKWKIDSLQISNDTTKEFPAAFIVYLDSNLKRNVFEFQKDGIILHSLVGQPAGDTLKYNWEKDSTFTWINTKQDPGNSLINILKLNKDTLVFKTPDNTLFFFKKQ